MALRADLAVTSIDGQLQLLVEVKTRPPGSGGDTTVWPAELRQQYGHFDCYFLLVTPERMLLFLPGSPGSGSQVIGRESSVVLANYLTIERFPLQALGEMEFTAVVRSWLGSILFKPADVLLNDPAQAWLVECELHERVYRGYITSEQAAA